MTQSNHPTPASSAGKHPTCEDRFGEGCEWMSSCGYGDAHECVESPSHRGPCRCWCGAMRSVALASSAGSEQTDAIAAMRNRLARTERRWLEQGIARDDFERGAVDGNCFTAASEVRAALAAFDRLTAALSDAEAAHINNAEAWRASVDELSAALTAKDAELARLREENREMLATLATIQSWRLSQDLTPGQDAALASLASLHPMLRLPDAARSPATPSGEERTPAQPTPGEPTT